jgi:hypothetical protein
MDNHNRILAAVVRSLRSELVNVLAIFIASATLFILLRTHQYLAVDGAIRCLSVYWKRHPTLGGNNHLLYFVNVFLWTKAISLAGVNATDAFDFVRLTHWMTAVAAAGSVSLLWSLSYHATKSVCAACGASCALAFSNAFLLHATSTAEPMVGLFWSLVSVAIVASGLVARSRFRLFVGGAVLLLAMATYESMVLIGPAELILICYCDDQASSRSSVLWFLAGCVSDGIAIYVPAYAISGTTTLLTMLHRFLDTGGGEPVYGGIRISKIVNFPIGFANSVVQTVPADYHGISSLLKVHSQDRWIVLISIGVLLLVGWLALTSIRLASIRNDLERKQRLVLGCCALALAFDALALVFWDTLYDKLWLQPLAVFFFGCGVVSAAWYRRLPRPPRFVPELVLVTMIVTTGFYRALEANRSATPCLVTARRLADSVRSSDLLVTDWDPISLLYSSFWGNGARIFDVPSTATGYGPNTLSMLDGQISKVSAAGGRILFLRILDMREADWNAYLGNRCQLPYHSLDAIRKCATPVEQLTCKQGDEVLWQLRSNCYEP